MMNAEGNALLSIVIPTYNRAGALAETLESLKSLLPDARIEIVVVDNCCSDRTPSVMETWIARGVFYTRNSMNIGIEGNIVKAATSGSGEYIWLLSDHMIVNPLVVNRLLEQIVSGLRFDIGCMGIDDYGDLGLPAWTVVDSRDAPLDIIGRLFFSVSNVSSVIFRRDYLPNVVVSMYRFCGFTYPNIGIYSRALEGVSLFYAKNASSFYRGGFSTQVGRKQYSSIGARFVDFAEAVSLLSGSKAPKVLRGATRHSAYISGLYGALCDWVAAEDGSRVDAARGALSALWVNPIHIKLLIGSAFCGRLLARLGFSRSSMIVVRVMRHLVMRYAARESGKDSGT